MSGTAGEAKSKEVSESPRGSSVGKLMRGERGRGKADLRKGRQRMSTRSKRTRPTIKERGVGRVSSRKIVKRTKMWEKFGIVYCREGWWKVAARESASGESRVNG